MIDRKMGVSIQQIFITKHYLMTNSILLSIIYRFKSIVRFIYCSSKLSCFCFRVGVAHQHRSCNAIEESSYGLLNKQNRVCSDILVIISVLCMHYEVSNDGFTLGVYSTFILSKYSKIYIPSLFLTMHLIFGKLKNLVNILGK